jgi:mannose-6-phosphate isomerase-like protein (cupin superfamily)
MITIKSLVTTATAILLTTSAVHSSAQTTGAPAAIYKTDQEIMAELDEAARNSTSAAGVSVTVSPGISIRRRMSGVLQYAVMHPYSVEIYRIVEGSGTLVTGGLLVLPLADSPSEDVVRTQHGIEGGLARQVKAGDVLVLQPGTPHWFSSIDGGSITYMESRVRVSTAPIQFQ